MGNDESANITLSPMGLVAVLFFNRELGEPDAVKIKNGDKVPFALRWDYGFENELKGDWFMISLELDANGDPTVELLIDMADRELEYKLIGYCVCNNIPYRTEVPDDMKAKFERERAEREMAQRRKRKAKPN